MGKLWLSQAGLCPTIFVQNFYFLRLPVFVNVIFTVWLFHLLKFLCFSETCVYKQHVVTPQLVAGLDCAVLHRMVANLSVSPSHLDVSSCALHVIARRSRKLSCP